jgi:hypothetical protein
VSLPHARTARARPVDDERTDVLPTWRPVRAARPATPSAPFVPEPRDTGESRPARLGWATGCAAAALAFLGGVVVGSVPTASQPVGVAGAAGASSSGGRASGTGHAGPFRLEATSRLGRPLQVTYDDGTGAMQSAPRNTVASYSVAVVRGTRDGSGQLVVSTPPEESDTDDGDVRRDVVTCRITDAAGAVVDEHSARGRPAAAACRGY